MPHPTSAMSESALSMKEAGNALFRDGNYEDAIMKYTEALNLGAEEKDQAIIHRNRAACQLKVQNYDGAVADCTKALEACANDPKALFRRCQAYESLGKTEEAFRDAMQLLQVEPKNAAVQPILARLSQAVQERANSVAGVDNKVTQMFTYSDTGVDAEKRLQAVNNLVALSRDESGVSRILANDGLGRLKAMLNDSNAEVKLATVRTLSNIAKSSKDRGFLIYQSVTLRTISFIMASEQADLANAAAHLLQCILNSLTGIVQFKERRQKYEEEKLKNPMLKKRFPAFAIDEPDMKEAVDAIFLRLTKMLPDKKVSGPGRDAALELLMKNIPREPEIGWVSEFMANEGLENVLTVAGTIKEHKTLAITDQTFMHTSVLLAKVYDDMTGDKEREIYRNNCNKYLLEMMSDESMETKLEAVVAICALLQGPFDVGNSVLAKEGILPMMLTMANCDNERYQRVAVEALVLSASKKDKCTGLIKDAVPILKTLYGSKRDAIRVRALVGLCKLGSFGGTDASAKSFAEGSTVKLAKACRKFLNHPDRDVDIRKWATEGMAYLTLDADVKDELVSDEQALTSIMDLARTSDQFILYPATQIFVNLTNAYDKENPMPELVEIARYSKQHIPEEHPRDSPESVKERVDKLVRSGVCSALVGLCKTDSHNSRELLSRVFLAIVTEVEHRGVCVQQGGAKALIGLALEGNENGRARASQALAKIAITINPEMAFPGQRSLEVIRPLIQSLHYDRSGLQNFEALMGLTNLASMNDSVRRRIMKEDEASNYIYHWMFEEHEYIRRAAVQLICNLVLCEEVAKKYCSDFERVKLIFLYSADDEEDVELCKAAAGASAILTQDHELCKRLVEIRPWIDILKFLLVHADLGLCQRGAYIALNLVQASEEIARTVAESELLELLMAISRLDDKKEARKYADQVLETLVGYGLIKPTAS